VLPALLLVACARQDYVPVDLQVDVEAELPPEADVVRFCVTDGVVRRIGAAAGRFAVTGLFPDRDPEIVVDVIDADEVVLGRVGPLVVDEPYVVADYETCDDCARCEAPGTQPPEGAPSWTLGLRFSSE
jgi:hypothetical protein